MHIYFICIYVLHHFNMYIYNHIMHLLPKTFPGQQSHKKHNHRGLPESHGIPGEGFLPNFRNEDAMSDSEMMTMVEDLCHTNRDRPKGFCWFVGVLRVLGGGQEVKILGFFMFPSKDGIDLGSWSNEITLPNVTFMTHMTFLEILQKGKKQSFHTKISGFQQSRSTKESMIDELVRSITCQIGVNAGERETAGMLLHGIHLGSLPVV